MGKLVFENKHPGGGRGQGGVVTSRGWVNIVSKTACLSQNNRHLDDSSIKPSDPYSEKFKK